MRTERCPECGGSGVFDRIEGWPIECEVCGGDGEIDVPATQEELDELGIPCSIEDVRHRASDDPTEDERCP